MLKEKGLDFAFKSAPFPISAFGLIRWQVCAPVGTVKIEVDSDSKRVLQWVGSRNLRGRDQVREIQANHLVPQAYAQGEVLTSSLVFAFVEITGTDSQQVPPPPFSTEAPHDFLHFFLETAGSITKRAEDALHYIAFYGVTEIYYVSGGIGGAGR